MAWWIHATSDDSEALGIAKESEDYGLVDTCSFSNLGAYSKLSLFPLELRSAKMMDCCRLMNAGLALSIWTISSGMRKRPVVSSLKQL
jgi:hypothetical protein